MPEIFIRPWPWYVAGPALGLFVPLLLLMGNKLLGVSSNMRHACAAAFPCGIDHFRYDWRRIGSWNLSFAMGILVGGFIAGFVLANPEPIAISAATKADLMKLGIHELNGFVPVELFAWKSLFSVRGFVTVVLGGFLVGFGTAYAGGCTSGHGLAGVADLQLPSLVALAGFFVGGILATFFLLPVILR